MSGRAQGRGRQSRRERPQRNRGRDNSADSVNSTTSTRNERERGERNNGRNSRRRPEKRDDRSRKADDKSRESTDKQSSRSNALERRDPDRGKRPPEKPVSRERISQEQSRDANAKRLTNDRHSPFGDDSRLSHLIKRITMRETEQERRITAAQQLTEFLNSPENFQMIITSADNICTDLEGVLHERGVIELKDQVARCLGFVGGLLGYDARKFFQWITDKVNAAASDDIKTLLLTALSKALQMDKDQQYFQDSVVNIMSTLQNVLENVDSPDLLQAVLSVTIPIAIDYPHAFAGHFRDTIDILVGWHIDTTQQNSLNRYTSDCLVKLHPYWTSDMAFSLTLLGQFLEDMEAYAEELSMLANDKVTPGDIPSPYVSLPKLTALVRVFTTVVDGIGPYFTPNKTPSITPTYLCEVIQRIIQCIKNSGFSYYYEKLFVSANECLETMCNWLQTYFACCCDAAAEFLSQQLMCSPSVTYTHIMSVLVFIDKVISKVNTAIPSSFIECLLQPKSPMMKLRLCSDQAVLTMVMKIYQGFLGIHDVPLLETAYRIAVAELKETFGILKKVVETSSGNEVPSGAPAVSEVSSTDKATTEENTLLTTDQLPPASEENPTTKETGMAVYEAETIIIFDLCALSDIATSKSAVLGLWKLSPTLFELFTQHLDPCEWKIATCCPAIQYTVLHALYTHAQRHHHFLPSSLSSTSKIPVGSTDGDVITVLKLLSKVLGNSGTPDDSKKLCLVWLVDILDHLHTTNTLPKVQEYLSFDTLAGCLLLLTFEHNPSICLDACQCLLILLKLKLLSRETMTRCFQNCIVRLSDTNNAVKEGFLELIKSLPTDILTSFPVKSLLQSRATEKKDDKCVDKPFTTNCHDIWWARKCHIVKQPIGSFHSNNFQVILSFLLSGQLPSKDIQDDWLSRLFHSCNRTNKYMYTDRQLAQFNRCESLLWFWATWEAAQFCILSKLRTPLGRAQETFQAIEGSVHKYASEMKTLTGNDDTRSGDDSTWKDNKNDQSALGPKSYAAQLQSVLLLQFIENLEKLMYNAYEGCAVGIPSPPKSVRAFFRTNRGTCLEWLTRIRRAVMTVGTGCGCPSLTVWHGFQTLEELKSNANTSGPEFMHAVLQLVVAFCELKSSEAIMGLMAWCGKNTDQDFSWMKGIAMKAEGCYEAAAEECKTLLDQCLTSVNEQTNQEEKTDKEQTYAPDVSELLVNEVLDCYTKLSCWTEVSKWQKHVNSLRKQCTDTALQHSLQLHADMNYVKALGKFEEFDFPSVHEHLQLIPGVKLDSVSDATGKSVWSANASHTHIDFFPTWSPEKASQASELSLMRAEILYFTSGKPKAKDNNHKDGKLIQAMKESIQQSVLLSKSAVQVGSLSWPPQVPASHFLRLQFAAAADQLMQTMQHQGNTPPSFLQGDGTFTLDPSQQDCAVMNRALRFATHLHRLTVSQGREQESAKKDLSSLQLATAKLARKHRNFHLAQKMLLELFNSAGSSVKIDKELDGNNQLMVPLLTGLSGLSACKPSCKSEFLNVQRECAKLANSLGHTADALHILCDSVVQHSKLGDMESNTGNLNARSLLTLTKWLLGDHKLLTGVTKSNGDHPSLASMLSSLCELEVSYLDHGHSLLMPNAGEAPSSPRGVASGVSDPEFMCGQLLHLSTMQCPDLGKAWFNLAAWCYRWGRKTVEQASSMGNVELLSDEKQQAILNMPEGSPEAEVESVVLVLGQVYSAVSHTQDEDIGEDDQWCDDGMEATRRQLLTMCPKLHDSKPELLDNLLSVWKGVRDRLFKHYHFAVKAYFMYLRMSDRCAVGSAPGKREHTKGQSSDTCTSDDDSNVTATLRLLRLLVKHAGELQVELEEGLARTPTRPWKDITPQLFSRLNHPESYVRQSVSELLCRVAKDAPHLIVFPAVVGNSTSMPKFLNKDKDGEGGLLPLLVPESLELTQNKADNNSPPYDQSTSNGVAKSEVDNSLQSCYHTIVESLRSQNPELITELQGFVQELRRITVLWEELWHGSLIQTHHDVLRRQQQLGEEIKRVNNNPTLASQQKAALIREKHLAIMKPIVFALEQLHKITSQPAATPHEQWFQSTYSSAIEKALAALKTPEDPAKHAASWEPFKQLLQTLQARSVKRSAYTLQMEGISPTLHKIRSSSVYMPGQTHFGGQIVTIDSVVNEVNILPTKTKPKKIVFIGCDGQRYTYLFKGLEDLHLDERIMQFLSICNNMFARSDSHNCPLFCARHYSVTPLGPRSGLIQWVDGAVPVFALYKRWQQREAAVAILTKSTSGSNQPAPQPNRPSELFYSKMTPALKEKGITDQSNRKEWPLSVMRRVLEMLLTETPKDLLAKELWCSSTGSSEWWHMTQSYARSTAVMSMIGYILGLGDRHLDNMLIDFTTGEVVHIDYNVCFEKGKGLRVPEKVPFRMTANLETALGVTGVEGVFRLSCEQVLKILKQGRETLLTLLEAFVYDPLVDWTTANDNAFASSFYGGGTTDVAETKMNKKEMERGVTHSLFSSRVAEMKVNWSNNRDEMLSGLRKLDENVDSFILSVKQLRSMDALQEELKEQQETLKNAVSNSSHPLHSVQAKYDEQTKLQEDHEAVLQNIKEKLTECQQWQQQHEAAMETVHGQQLGSLAGEVLQPLDLGLPSFAPSISFLQGAGQGHIVTQCEQLETELSGLLHQRRAMLRSGLDLLHTYATVASQFPKDYVRHNRSQAWQCWLQTLTSDSSTKRCQEILSECEKVHGASAKKDGPLAIATVTALISMEVKLQGNLTDQNAKFIKFCDRRKQESVETTFLNKAVTEALTSLKKHLEGTPDSLLHSLTCILITALCALSKKCLFMENTAKVAGERLAELTSLDGDWFLDELCSMSGNVIQLLTLLKEYPIEVDAELKPLVEEAADAMRGVAAVHKSFTALQELISNFRAIIVPETLKSLHSQDTSVLTMIEKLQEITSTQKVSLTKMTEYIEAKLKGDVPVQECSPEELDDILKKMTSEFEELLQTEKANDAGVHNTSNNAMTAGQMLLAGFHGLFTKGYAEFSSMLTCLKKVHVDHEELKYDIMKEAQEVQDAQVSTYSENEKLQSELFFIKQLQVMTEFFKACRKLAVSLEAGNANVANEPELFSHTSEGDAGWSSEVCLSEDDLAMFAKRFISNFLQQRILGLPSRVLGAVVIKYVTILKGDTAFEANNKDGLLSLEDTCKKVVDVNVKNKLFTSQQLSRISSLTSAYDVAWRKHDFAKRLDNNITLYKGIVQRAQLQLARFQWLYEDDLLLCPMRGNTMITPARANVMADLRKRVQGLLQMDTSVKALEDKFTPQESGIEQRLKWAAGANPALNPVLQDFEKTLAERKQLLVVEAKRSLDICSLSKAILHFEALRTSTPDALTMDKAMAALVKRCEDSSKHLEKCAEKLRSVECIIKKVKIKYPPEAAITLDWMKSKLDSVGQEISSCKSKKTQMAASITSNKEVLKSHAGYLKTVVVGHQQLIGEVKSMLTTMAKDEEAIESQAAKQFIATHNQLSEECAQLIRSILGVCSSKVDGADVRIVSEEKITDIKNNTKSISTLVQWIHDCLLTLASPLMPDELNSTNGKTPIAAPPPTFASALRQGSIQGSKDARTPEASVMVVPYPVILQRDTSSPAGSSPTTRLALSAVASPRKISTPMSRDPRTGKALQERNTYAISVWRRVKAKLDGKDGDNKRMSVADQVDFVIRESTSLDNLCQMYEGWTSWV